jgi:aldehyde:ferredoxin oxidoreductase
MGHPKYDVQALRAKHEVIASLDYAPLPLDKGYTRKWLRVNIASGGIEIRDIDQQMIDIFIGGKGFDMRLMWNEVTPETKWDSPENVICISSGPLGGTTTYSGSGKALVTSISPTTGAPMDSNVGGYFGPYLKFCGFDALVVTGKSDDERVLVIDGAAGRITLETAPEEAVDSHLVAEQLTLMYASSPNDRANVACVSAGQGAEHALIGCLNFSYWDWRKGGLRLKQAGRGGIGTVFRNKKLKALVAHPAPWRPKWKITVNS